MSPPPETGRTGLETVSGVAKTQLVELSTPVCGNLGEDRRGDELPARGATGRNQTRDGQKGRAAGAIRRLVDDAYTSTSELIESFRETDVSLSDAEIEEFLSGMTAAGDPVDEENIDHALYLEEQLE